MATATEAEAGRTRAVSLVGIDGHIVDVEAQSAPGLPGLQILGLGEDPRETRDRVRAAVVNSGELWPERRTTVTLSPMSMPKRGTSYDLAIAVAVLGAAGAIPALASDGCVCVGELALDGRVRPITGVLPAVLAAAEAGCATAVVPATNAAEARLVPEVTAFEVSSLSELLARLRGDADRRNADRGDNQDAGVASLAGPVRDDRLARLDLSDVIGQPAGRWAVEICAAGGHGLWLVGQPGTGATMLAERLPTVLPPLDPAAALEVATVHSVAGTLPSDGPLITEPPFYAPHHTASRASMVGGGSVLLRPGAASLAHRGVLFLDEAPEFGRGTLDALRQPLDTGEVSIARGTVTARFPARFTPVAAARPCPCAQPADVCTCSSLVKRRYLGRVSHLLDYLDIRVALDTPTSAELSDDRRIVESSAVVRQRVALARERAQRRLAGTPWRTNTEVPARQVRQWALGRDALRTVEQALDRGAISSRRATAALRVAWTLTDLAGKAKPTADEVNQALSLRWGIAS